jgi:hypothetical protein
MLKIFTPPGISFDPIEHLPVGPKNQEELVKNQLF